ncbi:MAG TPA: dihydrofolate reductase family protein [Cyclobacteriaceae bacterium]|nr:dihydrofolate reductase family protein [Cyclobacteriaceae bacterium]
MRKVVAAINMTLDGYCDHTAGLSADAELHNHYADLLNNAGVILYGRTTYQLMQFWQTLLKNPSEEKSMNDFAIAINKVEKLVFSNTLKDTGWDTAKLAKRPLDEEVKSLKQQPGKDIFVGSRSLIIQLLNQSLLDELQVCIHPVVEGKGLPLFSEIKGRTIFKLIKTKSLGSGAAVFYYQPSGFEK